jgi:hypothetical protein
MSLDVIALIALITHFFIARFLLHGFFAFCTPRHQTNRGGCAAGGRALSPGPATVGGERGAAALPQRRQAARKVLQHVHLPPQPPALRARPLARQRGPSLK